MLLLKPEVNPNDPNAKNEVPPEANPNNLPITRYSNQVQLQVYVILSEEKKVTMTLTVQADDKAMAIADQIAEIFGETKYSISFFSAGQKINLNDKVADLNIGYYKNPES